MTTTLIAPITQNAKLGAGVATTYRPVGNAAKGNGTCPGTCPHLPENGGGCYTRKFLVNRQQKLSRERNDPLDRLKSKGAKLVRLHTSGDFFHASGLDTDYLRDVIAWCEANPDILVWTYTHDVRAFVSAGFTYAANTFPANLHITASVESDEERALAKEHGFRTARVIQEIADKGTGEVLCPYDLALKRGVAPNTTCAKCQLCFNKKHKNDIAFLKH
jgi:hypothetical protein